MRRALLGLAGAVALGAVGVLLAGFVWPGPPASEMKLGRVEAFPLGSVTSFYAEGIGEPWRRLAPGEGVETDCLRDSSAGHRRLTGVVVHLVRSEDDSFRALSGQSTHLGEMVAWLPDFFWEGQRGWFHEPCHGDTYALDGSRIFGPAPRGLDGFEVRIEDGMVIVDPTDVTRSADPGRWYADDEPRPTATAWATEAAEATGLATPSATEAPDAP